MLQAADTTLDSARKGADANPGATEAGYFWKDGLLFRKWIPRGQNKTGYGRGALDPPHAV